MTARRRGSKRAAAAVEFALTMPVIALLLAAVVDWGAYMSLRTSVARAAADGARRGAAVFEPLDLPDGELILPAAEERARLVLDRMGIVCEGGCDIEAVYCSVGEGGECALPPLEAVMVEIEYPFVPLFGFAAAPTTIVERSMFVVEGQ